MRVEVKVSDGRMARLCTTMTSWACSVVSCRSYT